MSKELHGIVKSWESKFRKKTRTESTKKKRPGSIFAVMSVAHVDDDDDLDLSLDPDTTTNADLQHAEKVFDNGDIYMGQWLDNCPFGNGKFLWSDGCMYVGEWVKGKTNGKGKFSWPSGATYEGQFKNGYMDGEGTFTGSSNEYYKGFWVLNTKHGNGTQNYTNGDHYDGNWRRGRLDGHGRYQWKNGNQYIGQWKNGKMNGNGTMIWANGNRYDGCWEDGLPKGNGTYRWIDGSFYVGVWNQDPKEMNGTYYPYDTSVDQLDWDPQEVFLNDLSECRISRDEKILVFPSQKMSNWPCEGEETKLKSPKAHRISSTNDKLSNGGYSWGSESNIGSESNVSDGFDSSRSDGPYTAKGSRHHHIRIHPPKRQGVTITKGHRNYELMLNLQLGIRHSVGRPSSIQSLDLGATAFDTREKIWTKFPPEGSKHTPPHQSCEFKWKDYCPLVFRYVQEMLGFLMNDFRTLRKLFKVDPADYMMSLCGNDALRELSSPGKSGSFFYLTDDDKYMIKTMKKAEVKVLLRMLPAYYKHVRAFENTLITKFFGLHCVKLPGTAQKKVRFVIMGNLFCTEYPIHRCFDLKGSSIGRLTSKPESEITSTTTLKDLDLNFVFRFHTFWFQEFCRQLDRDSDFLEQERIMDYSLLLGIHFRDVSDTGEPVAAVNPPSGLGGTLEVDRSIGRVTPRLSRADRDLLSDPSRWVSSTLGVNIPGRAEVTIRKNDLELIGEPTGEIYEVILVFGIIDILQDYDISKKLEHAYKSMQYDPTSISAVDPRQYSKRFREFMFRAFTEDS